MLSYVNNPTQLDHVLLRLASLLNFSFPILRQEFSKKTVKQKDSESSEQSAFIKPHASIHHLLKLCLHHPDLVPELQRQLQPTWVTSYNGYSLLQKFLEAHETWIDLETFLQALVEEEKNYLLALLAQPLDLEDPKLALSSSLTIIQKSWLEQEIKQKEQLLKELSPPEANPHLLLQLLDLRKKMDNFPASF